MPDQASSANEGVGSRIRHYRLEGGLSLSHLAEKAKVSKGYIWALENEPHARKPSADTLYAIAEALGVTMSDLLGRRLLTTPVSHVPAGLRDFADEEDLPEADVHMLSAIQFRGEQPQTKERWRYIYQAIRMSADIDDRQSG